MALSLKQKTYICYQNTFNNMKKLLFSMVVFIALLMISCPAKAQSNPKFKNFTLVDSFSEGLAFAAIL